MSKPLFFKIICLLVCSVLVNIFFYNVLYAQELVDDDYSKLLVSENELALSEDEIQDEYVQRDEQSDAQYDEQYNEQYDEQCDEYESLQVSADIIDISDNQIAEELWDDELQTEPVIEADGVEADKNIAEYKPSIKTTELSLRLYKTARIKTKGTKGLQAIYSSSKPKIATVDPLTGVVKAIAPGKAVIKSCFYDEQTGYKVVFKTKVSVSKLSLNKKKLEIRNGKPFKLYPVSDNKKLTYLTKAASDRSTSFKSSKPSVAYVDQKGKVYPISKGTATITFSVRSVETGKTVKAKCKVKVSGKKFCKIPKTPSNINFEVKDFYTDDSSFMSEANRNLSDDIPVASDKNIIITDSGDSSINRNNLQNAIDSATAGTVIYLQTGEYSGGINITKSGDSSGYITIRNYPGHTPKLTCSSDDSSDTEHAAIRIDGECYIRLYGLKISDFIDKKAYGILITKGTNHIIIKNTEICNIRTSHPGEGQNGEANGILCFGEGSSETEAISNIYIGNCRLHDNTTGWCETLSISGNVKYINVIGNKVYNNTNIGIDFAGNAGYCSSASLDQPRECVALGNTIYNCRSSYAWCAGLYVDGARNTVLKNNTIYNCQYGIEVGSECPPGKYPVKNICVRSNTISGNPYGGIVVGGYDDTSQTGVVYDVIIDSNILRNNDNNGSGYISGADDSDCGYNGELHFNKCSNIQIKNNKIYKSANRYPMIARGLDLKYIKGLYFNGNTYYSPNPADIYFDLADDTITGVNDFNKYTGGNDKASKGNP